MKLLRRFKPIIGEGRVDLARFLPRRPLGFHRFFQTLKKLWYINELSASTSLRKGFKGLTKAIPSY